MTSAMESGHGPIYTLSLSPRFVADGLCFAAGTGGLLRSTDHGERWSNAFAGIAGLDGVPVTTVTIVPDDAANLIVVAAIRGGIGVSRDRGVGWHFVELPQPPVIVTRIVSLGSGALLGGTLQDGVLRSDDGGTSWSAWNFGLLDCGLQCLSASPEGEAERIVFAGTSTGIFRSVSAGRSWQPITTLDALPDVVDIACSNGFARDGTLFAATAERGLFRSTDRGATWTNLCHPALPDAVVAVLPADTFDVTGEIVVVGERSVAWSTTYGAAWNAAPILEDDDDCVTSAALLRTGNAGLRLLCGTALGRMFWRDLDENHGR